jgi:hypothetical protein
MMEMKMANEVKYDKSHHAGSGPEERIRARYNNSGGDNRAGHTVQVGTGPTRVFHNVHDKGQKQGNVRERDKS